MLTPRITKIQRHGQTREDRDAGIIAGYGCLCEDFARDRAWDVLVNCYCVDPAGRDTPAQLIAPAWAGIR